MQCVTCVCVWLGAGGVGGERIGFGLYQSWRNMGKLGYVSVFGCGGVVWVVLGGVAGRLGPGSGRVGNVFVVILDYLCRLRVQISVYCARRIPAHLGAPSVQSCCTLSISAS